VTLTTFGLLGVMAPDGAAAPHHAVLGAPKKAAKAAKAVPGQLTKQVTMAPKALKFGMALKQVAKVYDKQFDAEFLPLYKKAEPGPQMTALDAELRDKKALIRRNVVAFNDTPTGVDYTPLKGEYSYGNKETMSRVSLRSGTERYFFFIDDRLWKVYDEYKLQKGGSLGENFEEALAVLTKKFDVPPKKVEADFEKGRSFEEAHWQTSDLLIRAVNRGNSLGIVYVDRSVHDNISRYRTHKPKDLHALDPAVRSATKKAEPPADEKGKAKK